MIVIESDAPWMASLQHPPVGCRVANIGEDPNYVRYPMRSFPNDLAIKSDAATALAALDDVADGKLAEIGGPDRGAARAHRRALAHPPRAARQGHQPERRQDLARLSSIACSARWSARTRSYSTNIRSTSTIARGRSRARSSRSALPAGSAGAWARRSAPSSSNPTGWWSPLSATAPTCSPIRPCATGSAASSHLPVLTVICNNSLYQAVRGATMSMFKDGAAGEEDCRGLANLDPSPPFEQLAQAQGAHAERVERPDQLAAALTRARDAVSRRASRPSSTSSAPDDRKRRSRPDI